MVAPGPGDTVAVPAAPTYPLFRIAVQLAGAEIGDVDPVLTFACRPNNPTGELGSVPDERPLVVDEAYFEYSGETALDLLDDGVVILRTFSKLFGLAGARVGYALAARETADELVRRITEASAFVPLERLAISPQCGFSTSILGNSLAPEDQLEKLRTLAEAARAVWG